MRDCTVTVFNAYQDYDTDKTEYYRAVIHGVTWQDEEKTVVSNKEVQSTDYANIFIHDVKMSDKPYLKHGEWMNIESKERYYTLGNLDYIAMGEVDGITSPNGRLDRNAIERYGVKRILSVSSKRYGSGADHIKVVAS